MTTKNPLEEAIENLRQITIHASMIRANRHKPELIEERTTKQIILSDASKALLTDFQRSQACPSCKGTRRRIVEKLDDEIGDELNIPCPSCTDGTLESYLRTKLEESKMFGRGMESKVIEQQQQLSAQSEVIEKLVLIAKHDRECQVYLRIISSGSAYKNLTENIEKIDAALALAEQKEKSVASPEKHLGDNK
jgi:hypothetical protein